MASELGSIFSGAWTNPSKTNTSVTESELCAHYVNQLVITVVVTFLEKCSDLRHAQAEQSWEDLDLAWNCPLGQVFGCTDWNQMRSSQNRWMWQIGSPLSMLWSCSSAHMKAGSQTLPSFNCLAILWLWFTLGQEEAAPQILEDRPVLFAAVH